MKKLTAEEEKFCAEELRRMERMRKKEPVKYWIMRVKQSQRRLDKLHDLDAPDLLINNERKTLEKRRKKLLHALVKRGK